MTGPTRILAADIGGTNSRFGCFELDETGSLLLSGKAWLGTHSVDSFPALLESLARSGFPLHPAEADMVVFAVAGAIRGLYSDPPNIAYDVDLDRLPHRLGRAALINDFVAQAYACRSPIAGEMAQVKAGAPEPEAAAAVIGAGTGLGKAALLPAGPGLFLAMPSEGGHSSFPFQSPEEYEFHEFLKRRLGQPYAWGDVVLSGSGLVALHAFLTGQEWSAQAVSADAPQTSETHRWFSRFYGRACRNLALEVFALGGVYVTGGVAAKNPHFVTADAFQDEFHLSPTYAELLARIPVYLNDNEDAGLWGAALYGAMRLKAEKASG